MKSRNGRPKRARHYGLTFHCGTDAAADAVLKVFERVNAEIPIR